MSKSGESRSCGILLVRGEPITDFLLMKHPKRWDLPKGHIEAGESDLDCALRETWEETGIREDAIRLDPTFRFVHQYTVKYGRTTNKPVLKTLVIFLGWVKKKVTIVSTEHEGHAWFPWKPPHSIQEQTIDPLLAAVEAHLKTLPSSATGG
jgi:bis(5'-nucleosidyl)-tetraphosphatase